MYKRTSRVSLLSLLDDSESAFPVTSYARKQWWSR